MTQIASEVCGFFALFFSCDLSVQGHLHHVSCWEVLINDLKHPGLVLFHGFLELWYIGSMKW